ncbi:hypothetical protein C8R47DRAFT_1209948 [Mycena vitilis]|nr:hypothetical protein C8R47DRAFT_1209948 [Mycena vitilis]
MPSPLERHSATVDFLDIAHRFLENNPDVADGLVEREDFKQRFAFLATTIKPLPSTRFYDVEERSDSIVVAPATSFDNDGYDGDLPDSPPAAYPGDDVEGADPPLGESATSSLATGEQPLSLPHTPDDLNPVMAAATASLATPVEPFESSPVLPRTPLPPVPDIDPFQDLSMTSAFDFSTPGGPKQRVTLHDFFLNPTIVRPLASTPELRGIAARNIRAVELIFPSFRLLEIVYVPNMAQLIWDFLHNFAIDDLEQIELSTEHLRVLNAGPTVANCSQEVKCEADVEYVFKTSAGHVVAETLNILKGRDPRYGQQGNRFYPRKGTPGTTGRGSHAITDVEVDKGLVEIKTIGSIDEYFIPKFSELNTLEINDLLSDNATALGFKFDFSPPRSLKDKMAKTIQPIVQIWTQLQEKKGNFGQASSLEHSVYTVQDPQTPQRLYVSEPYQTYPRLGFTFQSPTKSGLYTMLNFFRIANNATLSKSFLKHIGETMQGRIVSVQSRNLDMAGRVDPKWKNQVQVVNATMGTVGVKYYDQPNGKAGAMRVQERIAYKEASHSRIDEPLSTAPPRASPPRKKGPASKALDGVRPRKPASKLATQAIHSKTASGSGNTQGVQTRTRSTVLQPTEASRGRAVESAPSPVRPATRSRTKGKRAAFTGKGNQVQL